MFKFRKFDPALKGFIYLAIIVIVPICPVIISLVIGQLDTVYFVMLVAAEITLLYDLFQGGVSQSCTRIAIENFVEIFALIASIVVSVIGLFIPQGLNTQHISYTLGYIGISCYAVSGIITIIEIIVCFIIEIKLEKEKRENLDSKKNKKIASAGEQV